jgi:hypothetical protein
MDKSVYNFLAQRPNSTDVAIFTETFKGIYCRALSTLFHVQAAYAACKRAGVEVPPTILATLGPTRRAEYFNPPKPGEIYHELVIFLPGGVSGSWLPSGVAMAPNPGEKMYE